MSLGKKRTIVRDWHPLETGVFTDRKKFKIGVTGVGKGAGATFVSAALAVQMGSIVDGVSYVEGTVHMKGSPQPFHLLGLDNIKRNYPDYYLNQKDGMEPFSKINIYKNVNWVVCPPNANYSQSAEYCRQHPDYLKIGGRYLIIDSPPMNEMNEMDLIVAIVDPLPSRVKGGLETFARINEKHNIPVLWVLNKDSRYSNRRELERFLKIHFDYSIRMFPEELFYKCEYYGINKFTEAVEWEVTEKKANDFSHIVEGILRRIPEEINFKKEPFFTNSSQDK